MASLRGTSGGAGPIIAGLRRLAVAALVVCAGALALSALAGALLGSSLPRAMALGGYLAGSFLLVIGVFQGKRGPLAGAAMRAHLEGREPDRGGETTGVPGLFLALGFLLVLVAVLVDPRNHLL